MVGRNLSSTLAPPLSQLFLEQFPAPVLILASRGGCSWLPRDVSVQISTTPSAGKTCCQYKKTYEGPIPLKLWEKIWAGFKTFHLPSMRSMACLAGQHHALGPGAPRAFSLRPRLCNWSQNPSAQSLAYVVSMRFGCSSRNYFFLP